MKYSLLVSLAVAATVVATVAKSDNPLTEKDLVPYHGFLIHDVCTGSALCRVLHEGDVFEHAFEAGHFSLDDAYERWPWIDNFIDHDGKMTKSLMLEMSRS